MIRSNPWPLGALALAGLLALPACGKKDDPTTPGDGPAPDLAELLGPGEVRAGRVISDDALWGGISAEGRVGDFKIYNDRVRFVVQGVREGSFYVTEGGMVIDADIVRPPGQLGRDVVDEWGVMVGLGRLVEATDVTVVNDGTDGEPAIIRVVGHDVPLAVLEGALELPGFVPTFGLQVVTEYVLPPDSWLLEVRTTVTAAREAASMPVGDVIMGAPEVVSPWADGIGFGEADSGARTFMGYLGTRNDVALGLLAPPDSTISASGGGELLSSLAAMVLGFGPTISLEEGESATVTRYYGVAPDLATLSDARLALAGEAIDTVTGTVDAPDGPVEGARVVVSVDGQPYTVAITDEAGSFTADVPAGRDVTLLADGRGDGLFTDLPEGAAPFSPYAAPGPMQRRLDALQSGAVDVPRARGRGVGSDDAPLTLGQPHPVTVSSGDGLPFTAWFTLRDDAPGDPLRVQARPKFTVAAWARDGEVDVQLEPGTYDVVAHRGLRHEAQALEVVVGPGADLSRIDVELPRVVEHAGWLFADPHSHGSPSPDGKITMEDRLVVTAASGVQLHFGTDHDHIADYRPVLDALGLGAVLASVVADEVSPPLRGHMNIYPVRPDPDLPNNGAWTWWTDIPSNTREITDTLRARHGDFVLQVNHPWRSGLAEAASWSTGHIGKPDRWTDDFQAVEVINGGNVQGFPFYLDLVSRGHLVTPVGVSDSHDYFGGSPGVSATFVALGSDDPAEYTDERLIEAFSAGRTIATRGVFLDLSVMPGSVVSGGTELVVQARSPSWSTVDRLVLYRDGHIEEQVDGTEAVFVLDAPSDASFVVVAEGDTAMWPVSSHTPWAMSAAILLDVDGDGWEPPLPPFTGVR